ncbi:MAG: peptidoglycan-binding protein [Candidatus Giovannonibacteria bacterium]|nr:MAG: peptidoglycan-binding protein [Candidatus Giovannonibacteria bacterium]
MKYFLYTFACWLAFTGIARADNPAQEIHILPDGQVRLVGAELFLKHTSNLYTVKSWDMKWIVPIDPIDPYIKFESAYGAKILPADVLEKHVLEISGKLSFDKNTNAYQILPTLVRDLSVKTGEPPPSVTPGAGGALAPALAPTPAPASAAETNSEKLTMVLKLGYWGGQVKILQDFLKKHGYFPKDEPTGRYFGPLTKNALMEFQKANALEAVGILGPKTRALINSLLSK